MTEKLVSIIIRTKNEAKWISACLRGVFQQNYKNVEVIIVDNESTDNTINKAQNFPVKIIHIKEFIPGKAINDGIRASSGEYIVCLSGHCIPVNNQWLENLVKDLSVSNIAGVYGRQEPLSFSSDLDKRDLMIVFGLDKKIQIKESFFHNANSAFRREIWNKYSFDETITNIEDRVWGEKVISEGFNLIYEPEASVYHWHGIHQDLNLDRAKNIVSILESLKTINPTSKHQKPEDLKILAIIPSRGEQCRMNNKPLLQRTIDSAQESKYITDIIVATDSEKTALLSKNLGVEVPFIRPEKLSEDYVDVFDVVEYTVDWLEKKQRYYDVIVLLEEVYPFRPDRMIDEMISKLILEEYDTVFAGSPETRGLWIEDSNKTKLLGEESSVSMPSSLKETKAIVGLLGLCCVFRTKSLHNNLIFSGEVGIFKINNPIALVTARNKKELEMACIIDTSLN